MSIIDINLPTPALLLGVRVREAVIQQGNSQGLITSSGQRS